MLKQNGKDGKLTKIAMVGRTLDKPVGLCYTIKVIRERNDARYIITRGI